MLPSAEVEHQPSLEHQALGGGQGSWGALMNKLGFRKEESKKEECIFQGGIFQKPCLCSWL